MAFSTGNDSVTLEELRNKVSEADIVAHYLGVTKVPCIISSPLRKDRRPSFGLYSKDGQKISWVDLATKERGGVYDLLSFMWHCPFKEVLSRVNRDFSSFKGGATVDARIPCIVKDVTTYDSNTDLQCKIREWRKYDIDYWASYGVPLEWLKYAEVYPISNKIVIKGGKTYVLGADKYAYAFVEHKEGKVTLKIYQPYNKNGHKWSNKHDRSVVSLWTKIPEYGDKVVICSSLKDALCLWANTGIPALAIQGEGYGISNTAITELKRRYKEIYILLDNDKAGLEDGEKLAKETGFTNIVLPQFEGGKDVSDLYKSHGATEFKSIITSLLNTKEEVAQTDEDDYDDPPF